MPLLRPFPCWFPFSVAFCAVNEHMAHWAVAAWGNAVVSATANAKTGTNRDNHFIKANLGFISSNYNYGAINLLVVRQSRFTGGRPRFFLHSDLPALSRYFANFSPHYSINRISL